MTARLHTPSSELRERVPLGHEALHGRATGHRGNRGAGYFRQQLRGEHPITLEDVSRLALEVPEALVPALGTLARALGRRLEPLPLTDAGVGEAAAGLSEGAAPVVATALRALANDGVVDAEEADEIRAALRPLKGQVAALESALARIDRPGLREAK